MFQLQLPSNSSPFCSPMALSSTAEAETHVGMFQAKTHLVKFKAETHLGIYKAVTHVGIYKAKIARGG